MNESLVESIREKTEETDLDCILKTCIGGYTKKSVLQYLTMLKQQQQNMKETYEAEIRRLVSEKEALAAEIELQSQRAESAEKDRADAICPEETAVVPTEISAPEADAEETDQLRREKAVLEQDMDEAIERIKEDEQKLSRMEAELRSEKQRAEKALEDAQSYRIMLDTAQRQKEEQEKLLSEQTLQLARTKEECSLLARQVSEGELAELQGQMEDLMSTVSLLHNEVALRDSELDNRAARIKSLTLQEQKNHALLDRVHTLLDQSREQNEWLESENDGLGERLHQQMDESIGLHREIARLKAANGILQRRLGSAQLTYQDGKDSAQENLPGGVSFEENEGSEKG